MKVGDRRELTAVDGREVKIGRVAAGAQPRGGKKGIWDYLSPDEHEVLEAYRKARPDIA